jgi:hypothetical protein
MGQFFVSFDLHSSEPGSKHHEYFRVAAFNAGWSPWHTMDSGKDGHLPDTTLVGDFGSFVGAIVSFDGALSTASDKFGHAITAPKRLIVPFEASRFHSDKPATKSATLREAIEKVLAEDK